MKNLFKTILNFTLFSVLIILSGCEKDLYEDAISQKKDFKYGAVSFNQIKRQNPRAANTINRVRHDLKANIQSKSSTDLYGFEVDTTKITYIEKEDGYKSYALKVEQEAGLNSFKNLIISEFPSGKLEIKVVKFNLSKTFEKVKLENSLNESITSKEVSKYSISNNTLNFYTCIEVGYYDLVDACGGELVTPEDNPSCFNPDGSRAYHIVFVILAQSCTFGGGEANNEGNDSDGGNPSDGTPSDVGGVGGEPIDEIFMPNLISDTEAQTPGSMPLGWAIRYFEEGLDEEFQLPIYNQHPMLREYLALEKCNYKSKQFVLWAISYLDINASSPESITLLNNILNPALSVNGIEDSLSFTHANIDYLHQNYFSQESINHLNYVLNEIIDNSNNSVAIDDPNVILLEPNQSNVINDINDYLDCFNSNENATFTLYVDQPTANSNEPWSGNPNNPNVGHTFISIKQGNVRRIIGFYPGAAVTSLSNPAVTGAFHNDSQHSFDVSLSVVIGPSQLNNVINYIKGQARSTYNLNSNNCTDFGLATIRIAGIKLPSAYGTWGVGGPGTSTGGAGDNPGQLGENIRNMQTPAGGVKVTTSGTALSNMGGC